MHKENLRSILFHSSPEEIDQAKTWYKNARLFCFQVSKQYGVSFRKTCAIMAALSPRNKWERNKQDTETLISWMLGHDVTPSFATYGTMVDKAVRIFQSETDTKKEMLKLLNGPKISNFFLNIYDAESNCVTVDTWIHLAAVGEYLPTKERKALNQKDFNEISDSVKELAIEYEMSAPEMQALIWVTFKRLVEQNETELVA